MALNPINFCGESWPLSATDISTERTVNFYPVLGRPNPHAMKEVPPTYLYATEGSTLFASIAGTSVRGCIEVNDVGYVVVGSTLYSVLSTGVVTSLGIIGTSTGKVSFADIIDQIGFVDGTSGWIYTISTNTLTQITDLNFPAGCTTITSKDGYFAVCDPVSQKLRLSNLNTGLVWSALDYALAQNESDYLVRVVGHLENIWAMGTHTTEQFFDSGNVLFAFEPVRGATLPFGLAAQFSVAKTATGLVFLGKSARGSLIPMIVVGSTATPIFNSGIIEEINKLTTYADAEGFVYHQGEHEFYVLTFPTANKTYVFDFSINMTHDRESQIPATLEWGRWFPSCYMNIAGKHIVGDSTSGNLFELRLDIPTENGVSIRRKRRIPAFLREIDGGFASVGVNYKTVYKLVVRFQTSTALLAGQGSDPQVMLRLSRNGRTFDEELWRSVGTAGQFDDVAIWDALGTSKKWCAELVVTDPIDWKILEAYVDVEEGTH